MQMYKDEKYLCVISVYNEWPLNTFDKETRRRNPARGSLNRVKYASVCVIVCVCVCLRACVCALAGSVVVVCFGQCFWRTRRSRRSSLMHFTSQSLYWWGLRSHFSVQFMFDEAIDFLLPSLLWKFFYLSIFSCLCCQYFLMWNAWPLPLVYCHSSHSALQKGDNLLIFWQSQIWPPP